MTSPAPSETLSLRALNRALLERQLLLRRRRLAAVDVIERLVGLQAQSPHAPYFGLWTRVDRFRPDELSEALRARQVVRVALQRGTIHLVSGRDALALRPVVQPVLERAFHGGTGYGKRLAGADLDAIVAAARAAVDERPRTGAELRELLGDRFPGLDPESLAMAGRFFLALVQVPPRGLWGEGGVPTLTTAEAWLGRPLATDAAPDTLVRRYLAAFGPASVQDAQVYTGLGKLKEVFERLRSGLRTFRDPDGRELFDLPDAPRPDGDAHAPPRYLPEFDNVLLAHAERARVIADEDRPRLMTVNGRMPGTVLLDGFVRAQWRIDRDDDGAAATLVVEPFVRLSKQERADLAEEGQRLLAFAAADAERRDVHFGRRLRQGKAALDPSSSTQ